VGTTTITDTREAQAQFDRISASEIAASNDLRIKRLALAQITGIADPQPVDLAAEATLPDPTQTPVNNFVEQALAQHPTMQLARGALQNAQLEVDKAKGGELPTVDLKASHTTKAVSTGKALTSVSVELNWPVFTGGATQNRILEARALEDKAKADLDGAQRGVTQAVRNAYFGVQSGLGQVRALQAAEASSQSALDANKLGYDVGVRINIDVLNAQTALFQTKADLAKARYGVALGALKLQQAVGNLSLATLQKTLGGG
jgi:outer membrane protein